MAQPYKRVYAKLDSHGANRQEGVIPDKLFDSAVDAMEERLHLISKFTDSALFEMCTKVYLSPTGGAIEVVKSVHEEGIREHLILAHFDKSKLDDMAREVGLPFEEQPVVGRDCKRY